MEGGGEGGFIFWEEDCSRRVGRGCLGGVEGVKVGVEFEGGVVGGYFLDGGWLLEWGLLFGEGEVGGY